MSYLLLTSHVPLTTHIPLITFFFLPPCLNVLEINKNVTDFHGWK